MRSLIKSAIQALLAISTAGTLISPAQAADDMPTPPNMERCYGIVKKGMNDCATKGQTCSGSAVQDNQGDAFVFVPTGLCAKIVGGSTKAKS